MLEQDFILDFRILPQSLLHWHDCVALYVVLRSVQLRNCMRPIHA